MATGTSAKLVIDAARFVTLIDALYESRTKLVMSADAQPDDLKRADLQNPELSGQKRGKVYEIWDKENEKATWITKSMREVLDEKDDPLGLEGFFPCPRPLFANATTTKLLPTPDFELAKDLYNEIDGITYRLKKLEESAKVVGFVPCSPGCRRAPGGKNKCR